MTQEYENNTQNFELYQKRIIMMGGNVKQEQQELPKDVIAKLRKSYTEMYFAFTSINWAQGKTLGISWQKALEQMDAYVATKTKIQNHPVNNELIKIHKEFRSRMAKHIMTSEFANEKLESKSHIESFMRAGTEFLKTGKGALDDIYKNYMPKTNVKQSEIVHKFGESNQMLRQMMLLQQIRQRAA